MRIWEGGASKPHLLVYNRHPFQPSAVTAGDQGTSSEGKCCIIWKVWVVAEKLMIPHGTKETNQSGCSLLRCGRAALSGNQVPRGRRRGGWGSGPDIEAFCFLKLISSDWLSSNESIAKVTPAAWPLRYTDTVVREGLLTLNADLGEATNKSHGRSKDLRWEAEKKCFCSLGACLPNMQKLLVTYLLERQIQEGIVLVLSCTEY